MNILNEAAHSPFCVALLDAFSGALVTSKRFAADSEVIARGIPI